MQIKEIISKTETMKMKRVKYRQRNSVEILEFDKRDRKAEMHNHLLQHLTINQELGTSITITVTFGCTSNPVAVTKAGT